MTRSVYDAAGQLTDEVNVSLGTRTRYEYDLAGRLSVQAYSTAVRVTYDYDALGNLLVMTDPTGVYTNEVNERSLPTVVSGPGGKTIRYEYDAIGRRKKMTAPGNSKRRPTITACGPSMFITPADS